MAKFPPRLPRSRLKKPRSREPSQPALSYEHVETFTKDLEVRRDLGNRASPVNRAHMKRPSKCARGMNKQLLKTLGTYVLSSRKKLRKNLWEWGWMPPLPPRTSEG